MLNTSNVSILCLKEMSSRSPRRENVSRAHYRTLYMTHVQTDRDVRERRWGEFSPPRLAWYLKIRGTPEHTSHLIHGVFNTSRISPCVLRMDILLRDMNAPWRWQAWSWRTPTWIDSFRNAGLGAAHPRPRGPPRRAASSRMTAPARRRPPLSPPPPPPRPPQQLLSPSPLRTRRRAPPRYRTTWSTSSATPPTGKLNRFTEGGEGGRRKRGHDQVNRGNSGSTARKSL